LIVPVLEDSIVNMVRLIGVSFCLALFTFCVFGVLASFEPPDFAGIRIIDGILGFASLTGAVMLMAPGIVSGRLDFQAGGSQDQKTSVRSQPGEIQARHLLGEKSARATSDKGS
jgi:hypothetical protein